jgi:putative two-component system response regulator
MGDPSAPSLAAALLAAAAERRSGTFVVHAGPTATRVAFVRGELFLVEDSSAARDELVRCLALPNVKWTLEQSVDASTLTNGVATPLDPLLRAAAGRPSSLSSSKPAVTAATPARALAASALKRLHEDVRKRTGAVATPAAFSPSSAEDELRKGKAFLREGAVARALRHLQRAAELRPSSLPYRLYAQWAEVHDAVTGSTGSASGEDTAASVLSLDRLAKRAVQEDPAFAFGLYVLGRLALRDGDKVAAVRHFRQASNLDPELLDAARQARLLAAVGDGVPPETAAAPPSGRLAPSASGGVRKRILVVEDDPQTRAFMARALSPAFEVAEASTGLGALELLGKGPPPSLILLDVMLPGIDGVTIARKLKLHPTLKDVPIVFVTAKTAPSDVLQGIDAGAKHYLTKPFSVASLIQVVERLAK